MKTSFYFFLWFIVYLLIGLTGNKLLIQNDFFVALIFVFLISRLDSKLFHKEAQYQANLNRAYIYEIFYCNDSDKMEKIVRQKFIGQTIWAIYCILTVAGLLAIGNSDIFAYFIFGVFGIASMVASSKLFTQLRELKENGLPRFDESEFAGEENGYRQYCELRKQYSAEELLPKAPSISKWVNIASIVFAIACIIGGVIYLYLFIFGVGKINLLFSAIIIWAILAIYFGVRDLIGSIRILMKKPMPSLK